MTWYIHRDLVQTTQIFVCKLHSLYYVESQFNSAKVRYFIFLRFSYNRQFLYIQKIDMFWDQFENNIRVLCFV